jgi:2-methylcitrate dehydratase PrpD
MSAYLDRLCRLAAGTRFERLSERALAAARNVVMDTLGAVLAGSRLAENARLARVVAERTGTRSATLIGHADRADPMLAALVNGTAGVALEMDEGSRWGGGHPAIHVLPAALAVAEEVRADGRRLIEALVAGYELTSRLGGATRVRPNVHSHGTWGTIGAAVAVARLHGHDERAMRTILNLAGSMSPANTWTPCFEGATIRNLYPGRAGLQGVLAVHLHGCGFSAVHDAPSDVYGTILADGFDPDTTVEGLADDDDVGGAAPGSEVFRIERNYFKFHACCLYNHPALDAIAALLQDPGLTADAIDRIDVTSIPFVQRMADPEPPAMLAAKFSVPYAVAAAVVTGRTDVAAFLDEVREDRRVLDLAKRVMVHGDPGMSMRGPEDTVTARVAVTLRSGRRLSGETRTVRGDAANPVPREELSAKFMALATPSLGTARARAVVDTCGRLEDVRDVRELTALVTAS